MFSRKFGPPFSLVRTKPGIVVRLGPSANVQFDDTLLLIEPAAAATYEAARAAQAAARALVPAGAARSLVRASAPPRLIGEILAPSGGRVGITFCLGKRQPSNLGGACAGDLEVDRSPSWGPASGEVPGRLVSKCRLSSREFEALG